MISWSFQFFFVSLQKKVDMDKKEFITNLLNIVSDDESSEAIVKEALDDEGLMIYRNFAFSNFLEMWKETNDEYKSKIVDTILKSLDNTK